MVIRLLGLLLALAFVTAGQERTHADLILHNGVIWTVDEKNPTVQAVAVKDGKFVVVGSNKSALTLRGSNTRVIDLKGSFVVPGFNDNHVHFASAAQFLEFNIMRAATQEQFVERVKEVIVRLPKGEWIVGGFWGAYDEWAAGSAGNQRREPFAPDMSLVNDITADYPMFIRSFSRERRVQQTKDERIGLERTKGAYAFRSIQASGAVLSFGTDWPGTSASEYPINPMLGLYAAVTRQTITGQPVGGWFPNERISIEEAIRAYTYNTAYANFEEKIKGSIEVGKLADLAVLSRNLLKVEPKAFLSTRVIYTVVGGKVVFSN